MAGHDPGSGSQIDCRRVRRGDRGYTTSRRQVPCAPRRRAQRWGCRRDSSAGRVHLRDRANRGRRRRRGHVHSERDRATHRRGAGSPRHLDRELAFYTTPLHAERRQGPRVRGGRGRTGGGREEGNGRWEAGGREVGDGRGGDGRWETGGSGRWEVGDGGWRETGGKGAWSKQDFLLGLGGPLAHRQVDRNLQMECGSRRAAAGDG